MRHEIADQVAAAFRDDGEPALGIFIELRALERIDLVADEDGDGHEESSDACCRHCERKRSNPGPRKQSGLLRGACHRARIRATRWLAMTKPLAIHDVY